MHLRAGLVALLLAAAAPACAGHDPLANAEGTWKGTAGNGQQSFNVTATVRRNGRSVLINFTAGNGGDVYSGVAAAEPRDEGRNAHISLTGGLLKGFSFDAFGRPLSGTELEVSSVMGGGTLAFKQDFLRAELDFSSLVTKVRASLTRISAPPPKSPRTGGGRGGEKKKAPTIPPIVILPK